MIPFASKRTNPGVAISTGEALGIESEDRVGRVNFLIRSVRAYLYRQPNTCPYCGNSDTKRLQTKKIVLQLRKCSRCQLMFRYPKDDLEFNRYFYQRAYRQGFTTDAPSPAELEQLLATNFVDIEKCLAETIALLRREKSSGRLLDYGCSWGYGVYQFAAAGYDAMGFEISQPRASYGREHLGVKIVDSTNELNRIEAESFDVIFCSHVIEHLPDPRQAFADFRRLLSPSGVLFIYVPNCGGKLAREKGVGWGGMISEKHCLAIDAQFLATCLPEFGFDPVFASSPYTSPFAPLGPGNPLDGEELGVSARRSNAVASESA